MLKLDLPELRFEIERFCVVLALFAIFSGVLCFYVFDVRLISPNFYNRCAHSAIGEVPLVYSRAAILDRNGVVLASNARSVALRANPQDISNFTEAADKLGSALGLDNKYVYRVLTKRKDVSSVIIQHDLTREEKSKVLTIMSDGLTGIDLVDEEGRVYTQGSAMSHIIGYVNSDGKGLTGIESYYDDQLSGDPNTDLKLSIDTRVQGVVSGEMNKYTSRYNVLDAAAIIMDVNNGEILAAVSLPDFDSNDHDMVLASKPSNKIASVLYEFGSVVGVMTMAAALDSNSASLDSAYNLPAELKIGSSTSIRDYQRKYSQGMTFTEIFWRSSSIGTAQIALNMGSVLFKDYLDRMSIFNPLTLELEDKATPIIPYKWNDNVTLTASYGYGITMTTAHLMQAFSSIVNGGYLYPATLICDKNKNVKGKHVIDEFASKSVRHLLELSVELGNARRSYVNGYMVGGRVGFSEDVVKHGINMSSFIGAFPINDPQYAIFIMLDAPKSGGKISSTIAGMIAKEVILRIAPILEIAPTVE